MYISLQQVLEVIDLKFHVSLYVSFLKQRDFCNRIYVPDGLFPPPFFFALQGIKETMCYALHEFLYLFQRILKGHNHFTNRLFTYLIITMFSRSLQVSCSVSILLFPFPKSF